MRSIVPVSIGLALLLGCVLPMAPAGAAPPAWDEQVVSSSRVDELACRDQLFIGVRGSGEPAGLGVTVDRFRKALSGKNRASTAVVALEYPAASVDTLVDNDLEAMFVEAARPRSEYFESVAAGRRELTRVLASSAGRCPDQKVVLVGFSQGAQVVTEALSGKADRSKVAATLLIGNPDHFPGQNVRELDGQVDTASIGLVSTMTYLRSRSRATPWTDRRTVVRNLVSEMFQLHEGRIGTDVLAATLADSGSIMPVEGYSTTFSLCTSGDMVCDAAPAMSRVLTSTSQMGDEVTRTSPIHGGYDPKTSPRTVAELVRVLQPTARPVQLVTHQDSAPGWTWRTALLVGLPTIVSVVLALEVVRLRRALRASGGTR